MNSQRVKRLPSVADTTTRGKASPPPKPSRQNAKPAGFPGTDGRNADDKDGNAEAATQLAGKNRRSKTTGG